MPRFEVQAAIRLEVGVSVTVSARDEDQASEKVVELLNEGKIGLKWEGIDCPRLEVNYEEVDQTSDIEDVSEL